MPPRTTAIPESQLPPLRRSLLAWFRNAKRDMPWRRTRDPYRIWLSEIMLQQTRVAAVIPYYRRFLSRFPTVRRLARARLDAVLRRWTGLGYYSRARNLHRAAKQIVARHGGKFPDTIEDALALPGIGRYTGAAVLSIAYGRPLAVLDGNVARVLARLFAVRGDLRQPRLWRRLQADADALLARDAPGNWNQAMMELGATVCTPRAPRCPACPIGRWCRARSLGITARVPGTRRKAAPVRIVLAAAVLLDPRGRTLMVRHDSPSGGLNHHYGALFSRLWQFPAVVANRNPRKELARLLEESLAVRLSSLEPLAVSRHSVTFREIRLVPFLIRVDRLPAVAGARTPSLDRIDRLPVSSATRKIAAAALAGL